MPFELEFYNHGVVIKLFGFVTNDELITVNHKINCHDYPAKLQFELIDMRKVDEIPSSMETARFLGERDRELAKESGQRRHIVLVAPSRGRAPSILWQVWAKDPNTEDPAIVTKLVRTARHARDWLKQQEIDTSSLVLSDIA
ncbi:hypothetical protein DTL21_14020 [Bremerella cremea]|uniref:STAS/SEC14 domain-containing protein n=1 Tax=Blastopirellula marina TaxID=124 RepID=A0A2S8FR09_9BACT|nr:MULTISPECIES: hypothetical protein [Pirellulaceae]PQO34621.1 hypothetical protein C5Y83_14015 [Blastopirellula marina]RCS47118.1 hypothetical protein DTL21_14020 [Bremerella cremea]